MASIQIEHIPEAFNCPDGWDARAAEFLRTPLGVANLLIEGFRGDIAFIRGGWHKRTDSQWTEEGALHRSRQAVLFSVNRMGNAVAESVERDPKVDLIADKIERIQQGGDADVARLPELRAKLEEERAAATVRVVEAQELLEYTPDLVRRVLGFAAIVLTEEGD